MNLGEMLSEGQVVGGGVYDCLSAAVVEKAGFSALALSGAGVAGSSAGVPDLGLLSYGELVSTVRSVTARTNLPVIVEADTGFGNELNTMRTCEELATAGAAAIMLEDQTFPKRCGHLNGKDVIARTDFVSKLRAAREALGESDVILIARTDALAVNGLDDAIERAHAALDAGADITFVEAPPTMNAVDTIAARIPGHKMFNLATGGRSPALSFSDLTERGFDLVVLPGLTLMPAIRGMQDAARAVISAGNDEPLKEYSISPRQIFESVGLEHWLNRDAQFARAL